MTKKQGRPLGTTRKNGFKVAVDSKSYWKNRYNKKRDIKVSSDSLKYVPVAWINKPTSSFMDKVVRGLKVFLSPPR